MFKKISFAVAVSAISLLSTSFAYAGSTNLSGWAWSSNIGAISFNSKDANTGDGGSGTSAITYAVSLATTSGSTIGNLSGFAWSPNIGFVSFNRSVTGNPPSNGTADPGNGSGTIATINMSTGAVSGWARAIVGCRSDLWNGLKCNSSGPGKDNGVSSGGSSNGWDGWIELSGINHLTVSNLSNISDTATSSAGVSFNTLSNQLSGFAWGNDVVGWLNFNNKTSVCVGDCVTVVHNNNITISSCIIPSLPTNIVSPPYILSLSNAQVSASGGDGTYTYYWSYDGINYSKVSKFTFNNDSTNLVQYTIFVKVMDNSGNSATSLCGTINLNGTVPANQSGYPELWKAGSSKPTSQTQTLIYTIRPGSGISLNYDWPTDQFPADDTSGCLGTISSTNTLDNIVNIDSWTGTLSLTQNGSTLGVTSLSNFSKGVYYLQIQCTSNQPFQPAMINNSNFILAALENLFAQASPDTVNSNTVEIDVVPSSVQEK